MTPFTAVCFSRVQPVSFPLCRRLPTEHVSGHLHFKVELTSTGPDGTYFFVLFLQMSSVQAPTSGFSLQAPLQTPSSACRL